MDEPEEAYQPTVRFVFRRSPWPHLSQEAVTAYVNGEERRTYPLHQPGMKEEILAGKLARWWFLCEQEKGYEQFPWDKPTVRPEVEAAIERAMVKYAPDLEELKDK